jgi:hypothetical protein
MIRIRTANKNRPRVTNYPFFIFSFFPPCADAPLSARVLHAPGLAKVSATRVPLWQALNGLILSTFFPFQHRLNSHCKALTCLLWLSTQIKQPLQMVLCWQLIYEARRRYRVSNTIRQSLKNE